MNAGEAMEAGRERLSGRELDGQVAERVMGLPMYNGYWFFDPNAGMNIQVDGEWRGIRSVPRFSTELVADYDVLRHVRDHWTGVQLRRMAEYLAGLWGQDSEMAHAGAPTLNYHPGDYSRAALAALSPSTGGKG